MVPDYIFDIERLMNAIELGLKAGMFWLPMFGLRQARNEARAQPMRRSLGNFRSEAH
jgi:hypothetical protein